MKRSKFSEAQIAFQGALWDHIVAGVMARAAAKGICDKVIDGGIAAGDASVSYRNDEGTPTVATIGRDIEAPGQGQRPAGLA